MSKKGSYEFWSGVHAGSTTTEQVKKAIEELRDPKKGIHIEYRGIGPVPFRNQIVRVKAPNKDIFHAVVKQIRILSKESN